MLRVVAPACGRAKEVQIANCVRELHEQYPATGLSYLHEGEDFPVPRNRPRCSTLNTYTLSPTKKVKALQDVHARVRVPEERHLNRAHRVAGRRQKMTILLPKFRAILDLGFWLFLVIGSFLVIGLNLLVPSTLSPKSFRGYFLPCMEFQLFRAAIPPTSPCGTFRRT